jgi:integrase
MGQPKLRLGEAVEQYNTERLRTKKVSEATARVQAQVLDQFVRCVGWSRWMSTIGPSDLHKFFYGEPGVYVGALDRVQGSSFNGYRKWLVGFEKWARYKGLITDRAQTKDGTWMCDIPSVAEDEKDYRRLSETEYYAALDAAGDFEPRDRAMMAVGMILATRGSECARLPIGAITRTKGKILVKITKSSTTNTKISTVALAPALVAELDPWIEFYAESQRLAVPNLLAQDDWMLFPSRHVNNNFGRGGTISYNPTGRVTAPYEIVKRHLRTIGIEEAHLGFHTLRRSGARLLYEHAKAQGAGDPLRLVQVHLNHQDRKTTLKYIGLRPDQDERDELLLTGDYLMAPVRRTGNVVRLTQRA